MEVHASTASMTTHVDVETDSLETTVNLALICVTGTLVRILRPVKTEKDSTSVTVLLDLRGKIVILLLIGVPVILARTEPGALKMALLFTVLVQVDGLVKFVMFAKFPAKLLPIIREHQYLVFARMVELVAIQVSRTLVIAETDFGALTASMNLMPAPQILVLMGQHAIIYAPRLVVTVLLDLWELSVNTTSMIAIPILAIMEGHATTS
jgi:hypothetical protein